MYALGPVASVRYEIKD